MESTQHILNIIPLTMLDLLKSGMKREIHSTTPKNITLVLGLAGSHKRDLIQFISGNDQSNNSLDNSVTSSIKFPGLTVDTKTNTAFYEYPEFGKIKTVEEEIAASFLLNKILNYADSIKLIFAIPESKNKSGLDDEHINSLIDDSVKIIENFDNLKDSIALVVTRVDNDNLASDEDFIKNVTAKLMNISKKYSMSEKSSALKKQNLINIFMREKNGIHTNIGVFKKSEKFVGKLIESEVLEVNKKSLEMVINVNTKFVMHDKNNFQCASCLDKMINDLRLGLSNNVREIKQSVLKYFENQENNSEDFKELEDKYRLGISYLTDLHYKYFSSTKDLLMEFLMILENPEKLYISIPKKIIQNINNYADYMSLFLQISTPKSSKHSVFAEIDKEHLSILTEIIESLAKSQAWYSAIGILYADLSNYYVKKSVKTVSLFNKASNQTCDLSLKNKKYDAKKDISDTIQDIFRENDKGDFHPLAITALLEQASITEACKAKLRVLSSMLKSLFDSSTDDVRSSCLDGIFKLEGQSVKLSDVPTNVTQYRICEEDESDVKEMRLFASNRVYIDDDLHITGDGIQLSIIAPTWEVVGDRKILLVGEPGTNNHTKKTAPPANPAIPGNDGNDGKPGKPGGPAGNFLGIGTEFIHGENLNISVIGGTGGPGQKGSNGIDGKKTPPEIITFDRDTNNCVRNIRKNCRGLRSDYTQSWYDEYRYECTDDRYSCKDGGNGGKGGAGGKGGKPGERKLIELSTNSSIVGKSAEGLTGMNGDPGKPGKRGEKGFLLNFYLDIYMPKGEENFTYSCEDHKIWNKTYPRSKPCNDGIFYDGRFNSIDIESPEPSNATVTADAINDYKFYLRTVLGDKKHGKVRGKLLKDFINDIEQNRAVKELYHAKEFAKELISLESQFYKFHKEFSFLPFYESLLNRITEYADQVHRRKQYENYNKKKILKDEMEALKYLYTATLSKIFNIRDKKSSNLIVDIEKCLDEALDNIQELNKYQQIDLMNKANEDYYHSLDNKINKAIDMSSQITTEIDTYFENLNTKIKSLIDEAELLETKVRNQMENLVKMNRKIKNALGLKSFFGITKMIGTFLSLAGPVGAAAGAALTGSTMIIESLSVSDTNKENMSATSIPKVFDKNITDMETFFNEEKTDMFQAQLNAIVGAFNTIEQSAPDLPIPESVLKLRKSISDIQNDVLKEKKQEADAPNKITESIDKVTELLEKQAEELGDEKYKDNKSVQPWSKGMNRAVNVMKIVQVPVSVYTDIAEDNKKSDLIINAYKESEDQLKKLDMYKNKIHDDIVPQFKILQKYLNSNLGKEIIRRPNSLAGLNISQWKMQNLLKDLRDYMRKMTEGFEVQEDITRLIEKLDRALITMIDIYRLIEEYRDKKELADYIKNVNPITGTASTIQDKTLKSTIDELKVIIQSNVVLEEYERVVDAVKQTVYPMAHHYLDNHQFKPFESSDSSNITSFVADATKHLYEIRKRFRDNRFKIKEYDDIIMLNADFIAEDKDLRGPFYTWSYAENKYAISQLLRGHEVTLKSDITKGIGLPAIKFREIGINFKFANTTAEKEFKKILNGFQLTMVHLGNSQYQCNDKFHTITNDEQTLIIEFRTSNGNLVFSKLKENEALLSPFASWTLSLTSPKNRTFDRLIQYENMTIDLALVGSASYLISTRASQKAKIDDLCNGNLSQYYNEDETIMAVNPNEPVKRIVLDEIPGLSEPIVKAQKNYSRKRRSLGDHEFEQDVEDDVFSTSGAGSSMKSSFINNIFNLIGTGLVAYEYFNPVNKIRQWFAKDEMNIDQEDSFVLDSNNVLHTSMKMLNVPLPDATELPKVSKMFIDDEMPTVNDLLMDPSICNHGNLLLLDMLIRSKSGVKYSRENIALDANVDPVYAQTLAYREHLK